MDIFLDLDGTLLDVSKRHYSVYCDILTDLNRSPLPFAQYWALKRAGTSLRDILAESGAGDLVDSFRQAWLKLIERRRYLEMDTVADHTRQTLHRLRQDHRLILVTLRQSSESLIQELESLSLREVFEAILAAGPAGAAAAVKARLIEAYKAAPSGWLAGDTELDVQTARAVGLRSCAVTWGLRSRSFLEAVHPDAVADDVRAIPNIVTAPRPERLARHGTRR